MEFVFQSSLPTSYREELERLVFFNANQVRAQADIIRALDLYGQPEIVSSPMGLHVGVTTRDAQCLFALDHATTDLQLAGMMLYLRTSLDEVLILQMAVADEYSRTPRRGFGVVIRLLRAVRASVRRLKGVQWLRVLYRGGRQFQIPINAHIDLTREQRLHGRPVRLAS